MAKYRTRLPQLSDKLFLTDAGMETYLIFHEGVDLPFFASFDLMKNEDGIAHVRRYYERFIAMARAARPRLRVGEPDLARERATGRRSSAMTRRRSPTINRRTIALMAQMRDEHETPQTPIVISGNIGPRGDGYKPGPHDEREGGAGLSRRADQRVRRHRGRPRQRVHAQLRRTRRSASRAPRKPPACRW